MAAAAATSWSRRCSQEEVCAPLRVAVRASLLRPRVALQWVQSSSVLSFGGHISLAQLPVWLLARQLLPAEERDPEQSAWGTLARHSCI
ncbi:hypothetical protein LUU34_00397500 [Aix galericulata]|nr:hypothetical protein LUU34_00397500 [Aix galericulata]